jgi:hypothetical protein
VHVLTTQNWKAFIADNNGVKIADGHSIAEKPEVSLTSELSGGPVPTGQRLI